MLHIVASLSDDSKRVIYYCNILDLKYLLETNTLAY
jgi:hypothetical protein